LKPNRDVLSYSFLLAGAVNVFFGIVAVINKLGIRYYFYSLPFTIRLVFLSPFEDLCFFIGSLYLLVVLFLFFQTDKPLPWVDRPLYLALFGSFLSVLANIPQFLTAAPSLGPLFGSVGELFMSFGGLLALVVSLLHAEELLGLNVAKAFILFLISLLSILIPIELWAFSFWLGRVINPFSLLPYAGASLDLQIFSVAYPLAPWLFIAFLFSWIWMLPLKHVAGRALLFKDALSARLFKGKKFFPRSASCGSRQTEEARAEFKVSPLGSRLLLVFSLCIGSLLAYSPYLNRPESWLLGDDADYYYNVLTQMTSGGVYPAFNTNKPLYFILLHVARTVTLQSPLTVIRSLSVLSFLIFSLSTFWLVKTGTGDEFLASLSSLFSVFSFTMLAGLNTGLYANWFALSISFLFFALLFKALRGKSKIHGLLACLVSISILFIHYSVWGMSMAVVLLYLVFTFLKRGVRIDHDKVVLGLILFLNAMVGLAAMSLEPQISERLILISGQMYSNAIQIDVYKFWNSLQILMGATAFFNPLMFFLSIVGMASTIKRRDEFGLLLLFWTAISSVGSILIAPYVWAGLMGSSQLWRFIFNIPFYIPAAIGLHSALSSMESAVALRWTDKDSGLPHIFKRPGLTTLFLLMNYAVVAWFLLFGDNVGITLFLLNGCATLTILLFSSLTRKGFSVVFRMLTITLLLLVFLNYALRYVI